MSEEQTIIYFEEFSQYLFEETHGNAEEPLSG
jgi:hypothetical protein